MERVDGLRGQANERGELHEANRVSVSVEGYYRNERLALGGIGAVFRRSRSAKEGCRALSREVGRGSSNCCRARSGISRIFGLLASYLLGQTRMFGVWGRSTRFVPLRPCARHSPHISKQNWQVKATEYAEEVHNPRKPGEIEAEIKVLGKAVKQLERRSVDLVYQGSS